MIRLATLFDMTRMLQIKDLAIETMYRNQIFQWDETYPTEELLSGDITRKELYVLEDANIVWGFACINMEQSPEYDDLKWETSKDAYVIHRLAIDPTATGMGYASCFLAFAEELALRNNCFNMRLDTFSENYLAQSLFKKNGYTYVGNVFFPKKTKPFYCYEKKLSQ